LNFLSLTFDVEEFDLPIEYGVNIDEDDMFNISYQGLKCVLKCLNNFKIYATFFTTAVFAECFPKILNSMLDQGHEIALHGYKHSHNYGTMDHNKTRSYLSTGKELIEDITGSKIFGFRAPRAIPPRYEILKDIGIKYDSSLHPTYVPGRYNNFRCSRKPFLKNGIIIIPVSVSPLLRLPYSWVWFRNMGVSYAKICTKLTLVDTNFINIYFHPWEFMDLTKHEYSSNIPKIITRHTGEKLDNLLEKYLLWCMKNDFKFITMNNYVDKNERFFQNG